jgi:polar amino acid transport system substrate-binding protein
MVRLLKEALLCAFALFFAVGSVYAGGNKDSGASKAAPASATVSDQSLQKVLDKGKFVLGLDDSFPPMGFRDDKNNIVGYDIDLAREACKRMGVELVCQPIDWSAKEQELATGEIDCIWNGFTITAERKQNLLFTPPYLKNAQVVVVDGPSSYKTLADLAGKSVGVQSGSSAEDALNNAADFKKSLKQVIEYKDNLTALMDLETGGIQAVVMDLIVANDSIHRSGKDFRILGESLAPEEYGVAFRKGDKALEEKVWSELLAMQADGTVAAISKKWLGADLSIIGKEN